GLVVEHRVVDAVHVRRYDETPQPPLRPAGERRVRVVEHRRDVEQHLEYHDGYWGGADRRHGRALDDGGKQDLDRVEAGAGAEVEVLIGMMHAVQPPEGRDGVEHDVLEVDRKIEQHDAERQGQPPWQRYGVEETPAALFRRQCHADHRARSEQANRDDIDEKQAEVVRPAGAAPVERPSARSGELPQRNRAEHRGESREADDCFALHHNAPCASRWTWRRWTQGPNSATIQ